MDVDLEAELVAHFRTLSGVRAVGVDVPHNVERLMPFLAVRLLPGEEVARTWQGTPGWVQQDVDVDLFTPGLDGADLAREVRRHAHRMKVPGVTVVACPPFSRRPEWNDRVRTLGAVFTYRLRA